MARLRFGVLGTLEVLVDGRPVQVPAGRRRAVLTCLLVHAGSAVTTDTLVEAAWGGEPPADPRAALQTVVSRLRALLGPEAVETVAVGYRLPVPPAEVDALLLEDLLTRARTADPGTALPLLERARRLWRGPPFGELGSSAPVLAAAARLEGMRHESAELHAAALLDLGDPAPAVPLLQELLAEEPYREHAVALLVRALYRLGRQAEALDLLERHRRRMADELGLDPSPELVDLQTRVLGHELEDGGQAGAPPERPPVVWLEGAAPLVGREDDLARLVGAVLEGPVTTLTGPGGVGKTRLAAEAVRVLPERSHLPVAVVELAGTDPGGVATAVAGALRLGRRTDDPAEDVVDVLTTMPHLLVVDDAEHLLAEVADLVGRVARRCRGTRVLVTSRRRLDLPTESVLPLAPLDTPSPGEKAPVDTSAAVRLFTDRVRRLRPAFGVDPTNGTAVAELCRRLDGLPLALELAASRTATAGLDEVLALLPADEASAPGGTADGLGLDRTVDWSYRLLEEEQRRLLARLSVFAGEFPPEAVRALTAYLDPGSDPGAALAELVETSLVASRVEGRGARLRLLGVVREYAAARLRGAGPDHEAAAHRAHAAWVAGECEQVADAWATEDGAVLRDRVEALVPDATAALRRTARPLGRDLGREDLVLALRLVAAVGRCLHWVPGPTLGGAMLEVAELGVTHLSPGDLSDDELAAAGGVGAGAMIAVEHGELDRARRLALAGRDLAGGADEPLACLVLGVEAMYRGDATASTHWFGRMGRTPELTGESHVSRALMALYADDLAAAREHVAVATAAAGAGSDAGRAFTLYAEGEVLARSDPAAATVRLREAAAEAGRIGAGQVSKVARLALLARLVRDGQTQEARSLGGALLRDLHRTGSWAQIWTMLRVLAELLADEGSSADAAFLLGAAERDPSAPPLMGEDVARHAELRQRLAEEVGPAVLQQVQAVAATTPRTQVVRRAMRLLP
ncbi:BTAD domain-containing putative transcriptional regulator [uncultured Ornithinimicrobium sp.]|uniref:BTAD domain-containing putative transcriptional regulator n=1 Tax=uncultured Ornithinimicrobium sp. TaxID=259307 RepID=UPI002596C23A|nr:BTAD domain-containing putative transcriptional regulator [uncultured Ornithinimicrobium sp.]